MRSNSYIVIIVVLSIVIIGEVLVLVTPPKINDNMVSSDVRLVTASVANKTILRGTKITSNSVSFVDVPLSWAKVADIYQSNLIIGKCAKERISEGSLFYKDLVENCSDESGEY